MPYDISEQQDWGLLYFVWFLTLKDFTKRFNEESKENASDNDSGCQQARGLLWKEFDEKKVEVFKIKTSS